MRKRTKAAMFLTVVVIMSASFMFGQYTNAQKNMQSRQQRCNTLIRFAIDKIETGDLQDSTSLLSKPTDDITTELDIYQGGTAN